MVRTFLRNFSRATQKPYQVTKLVNSRFREDMSGHHHHVICDIDKTYLETDFETPLSIAKIAFEQATDKVTVAMATDVLLLARWGDIVRNQRILADQMPLDAWEKPRCLHFVSSSPPQLRPVLEEKLSLDGLDWTSETFKDQVYNIKMGRMDLLRQHVAYKSLAILSVIERADSGSSFVLIGDNAESDTYIYLGIKLLLEQKLSPQGYIEYVGQSGVEEELLKDLREFLEHSENLGLHSRPCQKRVDAIYIRLVPGYPLAPEEPLLQDIRYFENFFQVALGLMERGWITPKAVTPLMRCCHNHFAMDLEFLGKSIERTLCLWPFAQGTHLDTLLIELESAFRSLVQRPMLLAPQAVGSNKKTKTQLAETEILKAAARVIQSIHERKHSKGTVNK